MFKILTILLCVFSAEAFAYEFLSVEQALEQQTRLAADDLEKAEKAYLNKYNDCIEQSKKNILSPKDFQDIQLNEQELRAVILYSSAKTHRECVGDDVVGKYLLAINAARYFDVPDYSVEDDPRSENSISLVAFLAIDEVKFYPDYLQIDKAKRETIEKIPSINRVFHITDSFNALKNR